MLSGTRCVARGSACMERRALAGRMGRAVLCAGLALAAAGCGSSKLIAPTDPMSDLLNPNLPDKQRIEAAPRAWSSAVTPDAKRRARRDVEGLVWSPRAS